LNAGPPKIVFTILSERKTMAEQKKPQSRRAGMKASATFRKEEREKKAA
jgi:hypothetical protein